MPTPRFCAILLGLALLSPMSGQIAVTLPWVTEGASVTLAPGVLDEADALKFGGSIDPRDEPVIPRFVASPPATLLLSSFDGSAGSGGVRSGTSWAGNVTQAAGYIVIGGNAKDDNGWGATRLSLNASAMTSLTITAQRDPGNAAGWLFLQLEDTHLNTLLLSVNTTSFAIGAPTPVQIVIGYWGSDFDPSQITGWTIGGGGLGTQDFRMSLYNVEFGLSAVPEPSTTVAWFGAIAGSAAWWRARSRRRAVQVAGDRNTS